MDHLDLKRHLNNLVTNQPKSIDKTDYILNNSFGMLSINSIVVVRRLGSSIAYLEPRTKELQTEMGSALFCSAPAILVGTAQEV